VCPLRHGISSTNVRTLAPERRACADRSRAIGRVSRPAESRVGSQGPRAHRYRRPPDKRSRPQRWRDAVAELVDLQDEYAAWLDRLPESLQETATADALRAIAAFDLSELEALEPPKGFGRD
jgi:hypothetical protein